MKTTYDRTVDALYIRLAETEIAGSEEVRPGVVFDFDRDGRLVGVEILDASTHLSPGARLDEADAA